MLYCSRRSRNKRTDFRPRSCVARKRRGAGRKWQLIQPFGGCCSRCGCHANLGAIDSHQATGAKEFQLDMRAIADRSWEAVLAAAKQCELLCSNCHAELPRPDLAVGICLA